MYLFSPFFPSASVEDNHYSSGLCCARCPHPRHHPITDSGVIEGPRPLTSPSSFIFIITQSYPPPAVKPKRGMKTQPIPPLSLGHPPPSLTVTIEKGPASGTS